MIDQILEAILLAQQDRGQVSRIATLSQAITDWSDAEVDQLLDRLLDLGDELQSSQQQPPLLEGQLPVDALLQPVIDQLVHREQDQATKRSAAWPAQRYQVIQQMYRRTPAESDLRNHLLRWLATEGSDESLRYWADWVCHDPPRHRLGIVLGFAPLMQANFVPPPEFLNRLLLEATTHSQIAPAVYDLFNFYYREGLVDEHPAASRVDALADLLGQVAGQLGQVEEGNLPPGADAPQINQLVSDSVALIVALCDTFAQLRHEPAIGKLHQALELRHRRVQTEAAAALAKLGDEVGKATLIHLAEQPIARLRVLAYADELGFRDEISLELQGEIALAESHLAIWLSEPSQMGLAPSQIEFLESRELYWPGYEHPVQAYLFRYAYGSGDGAHSNIAICGPMTHAFAADLRHLEPDDLYAAFAGWQAVHNEIYQVSLPRAQASFPNQCRSLEGDLGAAGFESVTPRMAASFFGQLVLIADAQQGGKAGTAIADGQDVTWIPQGNPDAPVDWQLAWAIWRGRQLLRSFNESEAAE